ncbi:hypothetical protein FV219_02925 [Methylobacterium sp. WL122]|nr:hypothetical protein FV219_02925 [Methylobacterium sp. WL122]
MSFFLTNPSAVHATCLIEHVDGDPLGVRMATSPGSSAVVLTAPWSRRDALVIGAGSLRIAAYILAGSVDLEGTSWAVYNGETIHLGQRLGCHARDPSKVFVSSVFVLTSRDPLFGKGHVEGLQWLIDARIGSTGRAHILRGARPSRPDLDAATWIGLERLLDDARRGLVALGCRLLEPIKADHAEARTEIGPTGRSTAQDAMAGPDREATGSAAFTERLSGLREGATLAGRIEPRRLYLAHRDIWAHAVAVDGNVSVKAGSEIRRSGYATMPPGIQIDRERLFASDIVIRIPGTDRWRLTHDVNVPSLSAAAKFVTGSHVHASSWKPMP